MKKLSYRAKVLLWIVDQHTDRDWSTGAVKGFFVPHADLYYGVPGLEDGTYITGAGDANAFRGLERQGLIERPRTSLPNKYLYMITEDGRKAIEGFRHEFEKS